MTKKPPRGGMKRPGHGGAARGVKPLRKKVRVRKGNPPKFRIGEEFMEEWLTSESIQSNKCEF